VAYFLIRIVSGPSRSAIPYRLDPISGVVLLFIFPAFRHAGRAIR
jgi:hypothetical protein